MEFQGTPKHEIDETLIEIGFNRVYHSTPLESSRSNRTFEELNLINNQPKKEPQSEAATSQQTEEELRNEIERLKCINEALISQNVKLRRSELNHRAQLEHEKISIDKFTQKLEKGVISDVIDLIQDESTRDFIIIIDDQEFPVHKFLLEARSSTLASLLRSNPDAKTLNLSDITVDVFEKILQFLYTDELPREGGIDYFRLFIAAAILKIEDLKYFAGVKSCNYITKENAIEMLNLSNQYGHEVLMNCAFDEIKNFYPNIKFEKNWINDVNQVIAAIKKNEKKRVSGIPIAVKYKC